MQELHMTKLERRRKEIFEDMEKQFHAIRERWDDRIRCLWALKMIAEDVANLDAADREDGFLPLEIRPAMMLSSEEAALAMHALRKYSGRKENEVSGNTLALLDKFDSYFARHR